LTGGSTASAFSFVEIGFELEVSPDPHEKRMVEAIIVATIVSLDILY